MITGVLKRVLLPSALLILIGVQSAPAQGARRAGPSPRSITGTYTFRNPSAENSLSAELLPDGRVKIYLYASWIGSVEMGNVRNGEIRATLPIKDGLAVYESGGCRITIRFTGRRALVTQNENDCDFGLNVSAEGRYTKRSGRKPKFDF